jgi:hypothetical protein
MIHRALFDKSSPVILMKPAAVRVVFWPGKAIRKTTHRVSPLLSAAGECSSGEYKGQSALPAVWKGTARSRVFHNSICVNPNSIRVNPLFDWPMAGCYTRD